MELKNIYKLEESKLVNQLAGLVLFIFFNRNYFLLSLRKQENFHAQNVILHADTSFISIFNLYFLFLEANH